MRNWDKEEGRKAETDKDWQETRVAMLVYLKAPHSQEGEGRGCTVRRQAEWVLELQLFLPLATTITSCFIL